VIIFNLPNYGYLRRNQPAIAVEFYRHLEYLAAMTQPVKITPMLQQYLEIKNQYPDAILFYRLGDFYEMFFEDAVIASRILGITLTSRNNKDEEQKVPLCGVPHHAAASYLAKLVQAGHRVAVCEQMEDPATARGVVRREVVRVVTPGLITEEQVLDRRENRYLAAIRRENSTWGLSLVDLSTGQFLVAELDNTGSILDELTRLAPAELLLPEAVVAEEQLGASLTPLLTDLCLTVRSAENFLPSRATDILTDHFGTLHLAGFGCEGLTSGLSAAGALFLYLKETQKSELTHIERLTRLDFSDRLLIDEASRRNLELSQTLIGARREGSLLATLDLTCTPMGARLLKQNLFSPLRDPFRINRRLDTVSLLHADAALREKLRDLLTGVYDLERLNSRIVLGSANARDLTALKHSLSKLPVLKAALAETVTDGTLAEIARELDSLADLHDLLAASIREDAPIGLREGNLIQPGYHAGLDELITILENGRNLILALEASERERTAIPNLKVGYNKVFGYYLEVSRGQLKNVPDHFIRKQTLVNGERFITPELKDFENRVLGAQEKRLELEYQLFSDIRRQMADNSSRILRTASQLAQLDFFACLAEAGSRYRYVRPSVDEGEAIVIREGRHPVIERALPPGRFVPNDLLLDQTSQEMLIITGPNMAGKSTVLRQTALIVLMAQMGSFVPASEAVIGVVDRIFTRVGAMDDLRRGQSTFMVEMSETANILNNATCRSLVILDEIGRGTSTYDGLSIAWAVAEELVSKDDRGVKTLFATHYHELTELVRSNARVKNYHIAVREWNDRIIFLHKLLEGGTNRSYGIQVAALAGVPQHVIARAKDLLRRIEQGELIASGKPRSSQPQSQGVASGQLRLFDREGNRFSRRIKEIEPDRLTPLEALGLLYEIKALAEEHDGC
jgi:DNA mismatch repair protein MutS